MTENPLSPEERLQIAAVLVLWAFNPKTSADSRAESRTPQRRSENQPKGTQDE